MADIIINIINVAASKSGINGSVAMNDAVPMEDSKVTNSVYSLCDEPELPVNVAACESCMSDNVPMSSGVEMEDSEVTNSVHSDIIDSCSEMTNSVYSLCSEPGLLVNDATSELGMSSNVALNGGVQLDDSEMTNSVHSSIIDSCTNAVSLNEFLRTTVLSSLSPSSREYSLLKEFLSLSSPDVGNAISTISISDHIPATGEGVSLSMPQTNTVPATDLLDSVGNEYTVPNSNDSDMSVEIPENGHKANTVEECKNDNQVHNGRQKEQQHKRFFCLYCDKPYVKLKQHLMSQHSEACEVAEMLSKDQDEDMQKHLLRLRNLGNHKHNCDVLTSKIGTLVVAYTPDGGSVSVKNAGNYVPCPQCFGYYDRKQLWRHCKNRCVWRPRNDDDVEPNDSNPDGSPAVEPTQCTSGNTGMICLLF